MDLSNFIDLLIIMPSKLQKRLKKLAKQAGRELHGGLKDTAHYLDIETSQEKIKKEIRNELRGQIKNQIKQAIEPNNRGAYGVMKGNPFNMKRRNNRFMDGFRGTYMPGRGSYGDGSSNAPIMNSNFAGSADANRVPTIIGRNDEAGTISLAKKEFVTSINSTGSADFSVLSFSLNPGLRSVFQWLSQLGMNYTEYEMVQCVFHYEPVVSAMSVSSVGSLGNVILSSNYNAGEPKFETLAAMLEYSGTVRGNISQNIYYGVECDPAKNTNNSELYVRAGAVPGNQDIKTYDLAKFQIGLSGIPTEYTAGTQLGMLWVEYRIVFRKPRIYTGMGKSILQDSFWASRYQTATLPLGTAPSYSANNSIGGTITKQTETKYYFPDDFTGYVSVLFWGYGTTTTTPTLIVDGNISQYKCFINNNATGDTYIVTSAGNSSRESVCATYFVEVASTPNGNEIDFSFATLTGAVSTMIYITMINPNSVSPYENALLV